MTRVLDYLVEKLQPKMLNETTALSRAEFVQDWLSPHRPVVLTEQLSHWESLSWTPEYLADFFGDRSVEVEHYPGGARHEAFCYEKMSLADYIALVRDDERNRRSYYLAEKPVTEVLGDVSKQCPVPGIVPQEGDPKTVMFTGWDTFSTAHYHRYRTQALLAQLCGPKRVLLFPPSASRFLYLSPWYSVRSNHSRVPFDREHAGTLLEDYPAISRVTCFLATLEPGHCLFIPDHWVHLVEGQGESLSLTIFWSDAFRYTNQLGFLRDGVSAGFKKSLTLGAQVALKLGVERPLLGAASKLGIIEPSDRAAIMQYLGRFGATRPVNRDTSSTPA